MKFQHVDDQTSEWLLPIDSFLCHQLNLLSKSRNILEIGVWKGAWIIDQLLNDRNRVGYGVDPYPGLGWAKKLMLENLQKYGVYERTNIYKDFEELEIQNPDLLFEMVHIDGEHTQAAVEQDLRFAMANLAQRGIIVVDDIYHASFPGIPAAVFKFLSLEDFASFMITPNKIYICRKSMHNFYYLKVLELFEKYNIDQFATVFKSSQPGDVVPQDNSVYGFLQITIHPDDKLNNLIAFENLGFTDINSHNKFKSRNYYYELTIRLAKLMLPGLIIALFRLLRRMLVRLSN